MSTVPKCRQPYLKSTTSWAPSSGSWILAANSDLEFSFVLPMVDKLWSWMLFLLYMRSEYNSLSSAWGGVLPSSTDLFLLLKWLSKFFSCTLTLPVCFRAPDFSCSSSSVLLLWSQAFDEKQTIMAFILSCMLSSLGPHLPGRFKLGI